MCISTDTYIQKQLIFKSCHEIIFFKDTRVGRTSPFMAQSVFSAYALTLSENSMDLRE